MQLCKSSNLRPVLQLRCVPMGKPKVSPLASAAFAAACHPFLGNDEHDLGEKLQFFPEPFFDGLGSRPTRNNQKNTPPENGWGIFYGSPIRSLFKLPLRMNLSLIS